MADLTTSYWVDFFVDAGIPQAAAANYAIVFTKNRIQNDMLLDLNKEYLKDMGITVLGDVIAILKHAKLCHEKAAREKVLSSNRTLTQKIVPVTQIAATRISKEATKSETSKQNQVVTLKPAVPVVTATTTKKAKIAEVEPEKVAAELKEVEEPEELPRRRKIIPPSKVQVKKETPAEKTLAAKVSAEKSSVFQRLGESVVSSTTAESESKNSIFNRLGSRPAESLASPSTETAAKRTLVATRKINPPVVKALQGPTLKADFEASQKQTARQRLGLTTARTSVPAKALVVQATPSVERVINAKSTVKTRLGPSSGTTAPKPAQKSIFSRLGINQ